ncbi:MAG: hypothetical protein WB791_04625 [Waddliaceae bacterium]
MLYFRHHTLVIISGCLWLVIGCFLLSIGLRYVLEGVSQGVASNASQGFLVGYLGGYVGGCENGAVALIALSLMLGFVKGRYVMVKSVDRVVRRICRFPNPTHVFNIYSFSYYLLIAFMVLLGVSIKYFHLPNDVRGAVDIAIGAALINGAMLYFRRLSDLR